MEASVWLAAWPQLLIAFAFGYGLGSVPFGLLLARLAGFGDIRKVGSGNIGATNVLRAGSKPVAALTLLADMGKGAGAVLIVRAMTDPAGIVDPALAAAGGALVGHVFPVWLRFRGGKGVATALGVYLGLAWAGGVLACLTWLLTALLFRYSSLAALAAVAVTPAFMWALADGATASLTALIGVLVWARHAGNIRRLLAGAEPKIGRKPAPAKRPDDAGGDR